MTKLSAHGTHSVISANYATEQDRLTYRRWARACTIAYSIVIVALLAAGFLWRDTQDSQMAKQSQTAGARSMSHF
jgi:hypothetical protein